MTNLKWTIGEVEVHQIVELEAGQIIKDTLKNATPKNIRDIGWLYPNFADEAGNLKALVQGFLIRSDNKNILIDTCNGNDKVRIDIPEWGNLQTDFLKKLRVIGVTEMDVNVVACTHLHFDHVGWNTKFEGGVWLPTFPNAKYLFAREEYEYWNQKPAKEIADDKAAFDDSVDPIVKAGLAELIDMEYKIDRHISFIPTPGHTPYHVSVFIESQNQRAIISGDFLHHPCQVAKPQWTTDTDTQPEKGIVTRQRILAEIADTDVLLIGSHFANPVAGRVVQVSDGFIFKV
ncbi:MAG: MBL fold metallo-hydrolase [Methanocellales archaeon]|nr:MBL fold metallo-hydrolase [Methanocellales archaeon]MDD5447456.1 MBL fold metallo-hydrolase [Methanocellales archaeon]